MDSKWLMYIGRGESYGNTYYSSLGNLKPDGNNQVRIFQIDTRDNLEYFYDIEVNDFRKNYIEISGTEYDFIIHMFNNWSSFQQVFPKVIESIHNSNKQVIKTM